MAASTFTIDTTGLDRMRTRFERLINPDARLLMLTWQKIMEDDNRKGVLAGIDKDGNPMAKLKYRPVTTLRQKLTAAQRNNASSKKRSGDFAGIGKHAAGVNNNLTSSEYRKLDGPALAPRRGFSRVITNFGTRWGQTSTSLWEVIGSWKEVVSSKGVAFLIYHFNGEGRNPKRDLRGIRPEGKDKAKRAARAWMIDQIRNSGA
jgi:hypothetical protein